MQLMRPATHALRGFPGRALSKLIPKFVDPVLAPLRGCLSFLIRSQDCVRHGGLVLDYFP